LCAERNAARRAFRRALTAAGARQGGSWGRRATSYSSLDEAAVTEPARNTPRGSTDDGTARDPSQPRTKSLPRDPAEDRVTAALDALPDKDAAGDFRRLSIVLVSSELARYAKSGGLADVADKLSSALAKRGHRVMTVVPMYGEYHEVHSTRPCPPHVPFRTAAPPP
jgi:hypothetical protein